MKLSQVLKHAFDSAGRFKIPLYLNKKTGYYQCYLKQQTYMAHRLVYQLHNGPIPRSIQVHFKNFKKTDLRPSNLVALTHAQIMKAASKAGKCRKPVLSPLEAQRRILKGINDWKAANPDKVKAYARKYYYQHRDKYLKRKREAYRRSKCN